MTRCEALSAWEHDNLAALPTNPHHPNYGKIPQGVGINLIAPNCGVIANILHADSLTLNVGSRLFKYMREPVCSQSK